jgi:hypothetical protein
VTTDRYRHRPVEIEALRWNPGSLVDAARVVGPLLREGVNFRHPSGDGATTTLLIDTPEGEQVAQPGDWIVRPAGGDWAVMPAADFAERYELAAAPSAPADRAALRVEIAEALMRWAERNNDPQYAAMRRSETVRANAYGRADAVLAVLPEPADRPVILREAAERVTGHAADHFPDEYDDYADQLAAELRRMADEAQQPTPCSVPNVCEDGGDPCTTHEREQAHAEGDHGLCGAECTADRCTCDSEDHTHDGGCPLYKPDGDVFELPGPEVVAYRNPDRPGVLLCREHGDGWWGLTPLTSDDLPKGGTCTYGDPADPDDVCGRDVLIAEARQADTAGEQQ